MRLARAASAFDKMECLDAYSGRHAFYAQLGLYDDTKRDSEAGERRILSTSPDVSLPSRRVVRAEGRQYIIGTGYPDSFRGRTIRIGHVAHEATHLAHVQTLLQACRSEVGLKAYAGRAWIKRSADHEQSSDITGQFNLHFASTEQVQPGHLVTLDSDVYVVRSSHIGPAGTLIAFADHQPDPVIIPVSVQSGAYDKVNEERFTSSVSVVALRLRWQSAYELGRLASPKYGPLDVILVFNQGEVTPTEGALVTYGAESWRIADVHAREGVWICRGCSRG